MSRITLNEGLSIQLQNLPGPVELCDPSGRVLGRFVPAADLSEWEPVTPDTDEQELDRRARSDAPRYSTAEVISRLEKR